MLFNRSLNQTSFCFRMLSRKLRKRLFFSHIRLLTERFFDIIYIFFYYSNHLSTISDLYLLDQWKVSDYIEMGRECKEILAIFIDFLLTMCNCLISKITCDVLIPTSFVPDSHGDVPQPGGHISSEYKQRWEDGIVEDRFL